MSAADTRILILTPRQLELVRQALVQRRTFITDHVGMCEAPVEAHLERLVHDYDAILVLAAQA